jgi:hypothetical protein
MMIVVFDIINVMTTDPACAFVYMMEKIGGTGTMNRSVLSSWYFV